VYLDDENGSMIFKSKNSEFTPHISQESKYTWGNDMYVLASASNDCEGPSSHWTLVCSTPRNEDVIDENQVIKKKFDFKY